VHVLGPIKFGVPTATDLVEAFTYPHRWTKERLSTGLDRLVVGPNGGHIDLIIALIEKMHGPFGILYVLTVPRCDHQQGRYQSESPCEKWQLLSFLEDFRDYFEKDGRHHLWIFGLGDKSQLVYDNHNVIYAYGPLESFERVLVEAGLEPGEVPRPAPHVHVYSEAFDKDEDRILSQHHWKWFPLVEETDEP
jgi:hypothetical protein